MSGIPDMLPKIYTVLSLLLLRVADQAQPFSAKSQQQFCAVQAFLQGIDGYLALLQLLEQLL